MSSAPEWPLYPIGPRESIFALGVASGKFSELESILHFIFSTIFELHGDSGRMIAVKIGNEAAVDLARRQIEKDEWGEPALGLLLHFFDGFFICLENRNQLGCGLIKPEP